ncbi:MAG: hypothetical protein LBF97_04380 [Elusimicrobiota bacterium]|jgi:hypothetical protein|nr:hypothetical protein [Elusimicrobiota bacterium]
MWYEIIKKNYYHSLDEAKINMIRHTMIKEFMGFFTREDFEEYLQEQKKLENKNHINENINQLSLPIQLSFSELCQKCGYPKPYDKQIEMMEFSFKEGIKMILGARRYGKTDYVSIMGVVYKLYLAPKTTFLIVIKTQKNSIILCFRFQDACE